MPDFNGYNLIAHNHLFYSSVFIGKQNYMMLEDAPKIFSEKSVNHWSEKYRKDHSLKTICIKKLLFGPTVGLPMGVNSQCTDLVKNSCQDTDLKMISSAYGMYIENDCAILENNIKNKTTAANTAIRQTRQKMQDTRLENYNAHNSLTTNDCIAKVREDLTADTACGNNFIHCLDFSGKYLNVTTGEPIYSPDFYQIENQISLSGDILTNNKNTSFVFCIFPSFTLSKNIKDTKCIFTILLLSIIITIIFIKSIIFIFFIFTIFNNM